MPEQIDTFMCVHDRDIGYLFELSLRSYLLNFEPKGRLILISNDRQHLAEYVNQIGLENKVEVYGDADWLSQRELTLPGWYRQQIVKLRAYEFCTTPNFCNLGADAMLLQPVYASDLVQDGFPILYYYRHMPPSLHLAYEFLRVLYIARILEVRPQRSLRYVDFINDLFCFNREILIELHSHLTRRYGSEPYYRLVQGFGTDKRNYKKFGEWTLYNMFLLDHLNYPVTIKNSAAGFLHQVHSLRTFKQYRFDSKVVHFVSKDFDVATIKQAISQHGLALGGQFAEPRARAHAT